MNVTMASAAKILMVITTASAVPWGRFSTAYFVSKGISATQIGTLRLVGFFAVSINNHDHSLFTLLTHFAF